MNRAETEDGSYASARNRKLLAGLGLKPGENEYAEPALNPCQTTAYAFFTGDQLAAGSAEALAQKKADEAEMLRLKREVKRLEDENLILRKAAAFFAKGIA